LTISVSTTGNSPLLARCIREVLEDQFDASYEPYLALLGDLRPLVQESVADPVRRRALWRALLDSEVQALLRGGMSQDAQQRAMEIIASFR
jgi:precorrin-2 dehydrogenase/sirohydrochlorin ferrochelatase